MVAMVMGSNFTTAGLLRSPKTINCIFLSCKIALCQQHWQLQSGSKHKDHHTAPSITDKRFSLDKRIKTKLPLSPFQISANRLKKAARQKSCTSSRLV